MMRIYPFLCNLFYAYLNAVKPVKKQSYDT